jgi:hypothetical protein
VLHEKFPLASAWGQAEASVRGGGVLSPLGDPRQLERLNMAGV